MFEKSKQGLEWTGELEECRPELKSRQLVSEKSKQGLEWTGELEYWEQKMGEGELEERRVEEESRSCTGCSLGVEEGELKSNSCSTESSSEAGEVEVCETKSCTA